MGRGAGGTFVNGQSQICHLDTTDVTRSFALIGPGDKLDAAICVSCFVGTAMCVKLGNNL